MTFKKFQELLQELTKPGNIARLKDKDVGRGKDDATEWYMVLLHKFFPKQDCYSLGKCIVGLVGQFVKNERQLKAVQVMLKTLQPYLYTNEVTYNHAIRYHFRGTELEKPVNEIFHQDEEQRTKDNNKAVANRKKKTENAILLEPSRVLNNIKEGLKSKDWFKRAIAIEQSTGQRSIDILNPAVAEYSLIPGEEDYLEMKGHSKGRGHYNPDNLEEEMDRVRKIGIVGGKASDVLKGIKQIQEEKKKEIK